MLYLIVIILSALIALVLFLWQLSNMIAIFSGCLYIKADSKSIEKILKKYAQKDFLFMELGSGNGEILLLAEKLKMKADGFEIAPYYYLVSKIRTIFKKNISVKYQNVLKADLRKADIIYCYLLPKLLKKLIPKFLSQLKKKTILISAGFPIEGLKLIRQYNIKQRKYFVYQKC